ncbi:MAG: hypothetical protein JNL54_04380 [Kineosporiaceae bacterium]|nr:hypothetical protein [Kineosporiaceae bacterium]
MTRQESFKARIRHRMATTGERYLAARRVLLLQARPVDSPRPWAALPEMSDEAIRRGTGKGWDDWCELIETSVGADRGHPAIAAFLRAAHGLDGWWSQAVTIGYERITGLRLPYQLADGSFAASKSRIVRADVHALRAALLDDGQRGELFPDTVTELRSRPSSRSILSLATGMGPPGLPRAWDHPGVV